MSEIGHLEKESLFDQMDESEIQLLLEIFQKVTVASGEYVFKENDGGDSLYIVEKGVVSLKKQIVNDYEKTMFVAQQGSVFGEFSFIDCRERSASALAENDSVLLGLKWDDFENFVKENPLIGTKLYNNLVATIVKRLRQTNEILREAILWGIETTGTHALNFQNIISENINIRLELNNKRILEGRIIQLEQSDAGYELVLAESNGILSLVPYHAITTVSVSQAEAAVS